MSEPTAYRTSSDAIVADDRRMLLRNRVSWGAIIAGVVAALTVQLLLNILGVGVGALSLDAANMADNPTVGGFAITATVWWVGSGIIASLVGGLVAGRLCGAGSRGTAAWHGFVSWCSATLIVAYLLTTALGGLLGGASSVLGNALGNLGNAATSTVSGAAQGTTLGGGSDSLQATVQRLVNPNDAQGIESDIATYIRASVNGDQQAADAARDQAVNDLARVANISQDEAKTRIQQAEQQYRQTLDQAKAQATRAAQAARAGVAQAGLYGFIALLVGAIAGWIGGAVGAPRRDPSVYARDFPRRR